MTRIASRTPTVTALLDSGPAHLENGPAALEENTATLEENTATLEENTATLEENTATLENNTACSRHTTLRRTGTALLLALSVLVPATAGCAVQDAYLRHDDEILSRVGVPRPGTERAARIRQEGTHVSVEAIQLCDRVERLEIERTHVFSRRSRKPMVPILAAIGGAAAVALGAFAIVRAPNLPESRPDLETGWTRSQARGLGGLLVGGGGVLALGTVGHAFRLARGERTTETVTEAGEVLQSGVACPSPIPWQGAEMRLGAISLGTTPSTGRAELDLDLAVLPRDIAGAPPNVDLRIDGRTVGQVNLAPIRHVHQERAWRDAGQVRCAAPERPDDCDALNAYLIRYPDGPHATEARRILESAAGALVEAAARRRAEAEEAAARLRQAAAESMAALERQRAESERRLREEERERARAERERERDRARHIAEQREAEQRHRQTRERTQARRACHATCRQTCGGNQACQTACQTTQCQ